MRKNVIITGGGSGLGFELAKLFVYKDYQVILLGRDEAKIKAAAKRLSNETDYFPLDISNSKEVEGLMPYMKKRYDPIHFLINNAGSGWFEKPENYSADHIYSMVNANLTGMMLLTGKFIPELDERATIVNIMSTSSWIGRAGESIYCAAKYGARGYTEALRADLKNSLIRVMAVYPGGMDTPFWEAANRDISQTKMMSPAAIAEIIVDNLFREGAFVSDITINRPK